MIGHSQPTNTQAESNMMVAIPVWDRFLDVFGGGNKKGTHGIVP